MTATNLGEVAARDDLAAKPRADALTAARSEVSFVSGDGHCAAWLYRPASDEAAACVVLAHGFGGVREARLWAYAERFVQAGIAALELLKLTAAGLRDELRRLRGRTPLYVPIVGPPGSLAAITTSDAEAGYSALFEHGDEFRNEIAARILLRVGPYRPGTKSARIHCPWLVAVADHDAVTAPGPAVSAASRAPRAELRTYPGGHFDVYVGETFERVVADQVDFLTRHLLAAQPRAERPATSSALGERRAER